MDKELPDSSAEARGPRPADPQRLVERVDDSERRSLHAMRQQCKHSERYSRAKASRDQMRAHERKSRDVAAAVGCGASDASAQLNGGVGCRCRCELRCALLQISYGRSRMYPYCWSHRVPATRRPDEQRSRVHRLRSAAGSQQRLRPATSDMAPGAALVHLTSLCLIPMSTAHVRAHD